MNKRIARKILKDQARYHPHQIASATTVLKEKHRKRKYRD